ncbi:hypothetical protein LX86_004456 [Lentzea aerocolonigenes]|nr:hypothetical protein [Lentzea aerocolonigenes]
MTRQNTVTPSGALDPLPALDHLSEIAIAVFETHLSHAERCVGCGTSWPCEQVVLAHHNLAVL